MFEEEENNTDFTAGTILGAILRKERKMFQIFGQKESKKSSTKNGSSFSAKDKTDFKENIEEQKKHTTYNWPPSSSKGNNTYRKKYQGRYNESENQFSNWTDERMKSYNQKKKSSTAGAEHPTND